VAPKLWPHQQAAVDAVKKTLRRADRCCVFSATGTGKTRTELEVMSPRNRRKVIVLDAQQ
jgi:superfamily II DNA or RNA helicase